MNIKPCEDKPSPVVQKARNNSLEGKFSFELDELKENYQVIGKVGAEDYCSVILHAKKLDGEKVYHRNVKFNPPLSEQLLQ
jgi:hypothetical protein